jgi:hypothetical protein
VNKKIGLESGQNLLPETGFESLWAEVFQPGSPLAFLTAQGLRVAAPVLGVFTTATGMSALESLADRLEKPPASEGEPEDADA